MNEKTALTEESKTETSTEQNTEKPKGQKKLSGKKYGIIVVAAVILSAVIIGFSIYNTPANRLYRQLDLGQRYLEELNYEQAIIEFDKAIAIDPMSVEAYLGKAEAYIALDDLQAAVETLQAGYDLTGDERLKEKLGEIYIELPFDIADITIQGYDLLESHFEEVIEAFGCPMEEFIDTEYGYMAAENDEYYDSFHYGIGDSTISYVSYPSDSDQVVELWISHPKDSSDLGYIDVAESFCNLPVYAGASYEEWCENMGIDILKNTMESIQGEENGDVYTVYADGSMLVKSKNNYYRILYVETLISFDDDHGSALYCDLYFDDCTGGTNYWIRAIFDAAGDYNEVGYLRENDGRYPNGLGEFLR